MTPDLILHIGQSKTGTSSIQRVLGARRAALAALGVCYPLSPGWANHGLLPASLVPVERLGHFHPNVWEGMPPAARLARFRADFAAELAAIPANTRLLLISAEQMFGLLDTEESLGALRDLLAPRVGSVRVVMYLRRQDSHFASGYTQALRVGHVGPPVLPPGGPEQLRGYDYDAILDLWARVFGEAAMQPRVFEPESLLNRDVVDDFLAFCGIELDVAKDDPDRQSNLSLTPGGIDLVRAMAEALTDAPGGLNGASPLWRRFVAAANEHLPGRGWKPAPTEAAAFLARFAAVNEAVRRRWFPDRPSLFAALPVEAGTPSATPTAPPIDRAAALEAALMLILRETEAAMSREAQLQSNIGRLRERLGEHEGARTAWRAALRADPSHPMAQQRLAEAALATGDRASAEAHLAVLKAAHPAHPLTQRVARMVAKAAHA
ncbi:MAG TPA: tetratricopeptide repeat protein [Falsiroseomonas sp.]|jgi:tetratricopeptide (TPR) repeat protein|nr:tetratricopeptide repeat protein [Falsiroseomonas sp.]